MRTSQRLRRIQFSEESRWSLARACACPSLDEPKTVSYTTSSISKVGFLQQHFWDNAGFGTLKDLSDLDQIPYRFHV